MLGAGTSVKGREPFLVLAEFDAEALASGLERLQVDDHDSDCFDV